MNSLILALNLTAASFAGAAEAHQQNSWSAWFGCWQAEGAPAGEVMCIAPTSTGVRISTLVNGAVQDESNITADGLARRVNQQNCSGNERARWSSDGRRVFLDSDVACSGSSRRVVKGMFAFVAPDEWISVQTASDGDSVATRIVRFISVDTRQLSGVAARFTSGSVVTESMLAVEERDVAEAVEHLGAPAVQEWMREAGEPFQLGYQTQDRGSGSALDQVGRFSNPVPVREVVRVVERPVYVHNHYDYDYYRWHYSPWGYRYYGWHWVHRPVIVVRLPIYIGRNTHYRSDYYRYRHRRYDDWRYGRNDDWRRRDHDNWRDNDRDYDRDRDRGNGGRVTRDGYSGGRSAQTREESTVAQPERTQRSSTTTVSRERSAQPRERSSDSRERVSEPSRERSPARSEGVRESSRSSGSSGSSRSSDGGSRTAKARGSR
jgi:hypothetical protein